MVLSCMKVTMVAWVFDLFLSTCDCVGVCGALFETLVHRMSYVCLKLMLRLVAFNAFVTNRVPITSFFVFAYQLNVGRFESILRPEGKH